MADAQFSMKSVMIDVDIGTVLFCIDLMIILELWFFFFFLFLPVSANFYFYGVYKLIPILYLNLKA